MFTVFHSLATHFPGEFQQVLCVCACVCALSRPFSFNLQLESLCSGEN